jgi:hypothetical protein
MRIWKRREAEIALGKFKVGWPGKRILFEELCNEFGREAMERANERVYGQRIV